MKVSFIGDHAAMIIEFNDNDYNFDLNNSMCKEVKKMKKFDYFRINQCTLVNGYETLPDNPSINDLYTMWQSWLNGCLIIKRSSGGLFTEKDQKLYSLNTEEDINGYFNNWIRNANTNLS